MTATVTPSGAATVWQRLAEPIPVAHIQWRQDGQPKAGRDGRHYARYVAYIDAQLVRERLDAVVPGAWDLTLDLLPTRMAGDETEYAFKARLSILGVHREDVGQGKDYKSAASDALKRVAVRFGIAHELYSLPVTWVAVDGGGQYAKPLESPAAVAARKSRALPLGAVGAARVAVSPTWSRSQGLAPLIEVSGSAAATHAPRGETQ